MLVPVCVDGARNEWSIVELQGGLVADDGAALAGGVDIGTLRFVDGVPTIRIGNHILAGKVAKLPKPFAILQKEQEDVDASGPGAQTQDQPLSDGGMSDSSADNSTDAAAQSATPRVRYEVVGIARSRVVFNSRPKPVLVE